MFLWAIQDRKIIGFFEDSFYGFKKEYFNVRLIGGHHPLWLTLEGELQFLTFWKYEATADYLVKVAYKGLSLENKNIIEVLLAIFRNRALNHRHVMSDQDTGRQYVDS
ncbi:uncharacterized protein DS421_13g389340 [Arachis hypogaea]|nr:uncharacterized protein DS421_13g389340 [Arachis hypogaea]